MTWLPDFLRNFFAAFELLMGILFLSQARNIGALRYMFAREMKDPEFGERFCAVVARRQEMEDVKSAPWRIVGALAVVISPLVYFQVIQPAMGYAITVVGLGCVLTYSLLHLRNRTARRAASLTPRVAGSSLPWWVYALSIPIALAPLTFLTNPNLEFVAAVVAIVAAAMIALSALVAEKMAALLTGDDPEIELIVEERARRTRTYGLLGLGTGASFVFMSLAVNTEHAKPYQALALMVASFSWLAIWIWNTRLLLHKGKPRGGNVRVA